jgi:SAM-dependent methyltransferase
MGEKYPLNLMQCLSCSHVQGEYVIPPDVLYSADYKYATPAAMQAHWKKYAQKLKTRYPRAGKVLEIGCNAGGMLQELRSRYPLVIGVDPAASGENTLPYFFNLETAKKLRQDFGKFDLIVANNVFAHIDNLQDAFRGVEWLLDKAGVLVFEVQYLPDLVKNCAFDTIYHEHHDYHTLGPLQKFVRRFGLEIKGVDKFHVHGGSMRVHVRRAPQSSKVFNEVINWEAFACAIESMKQGTLEALSGKQVKMFGAPAKATTLIHHFGIQNHIIYAVDSTPQKQDRYIPGTDIKIFPENILGHTKSTTEMFLAAWNYREEIQKKYPDIHFITPQFQRMKLAA